MGTKQAAGIYLMFGFIMPAVISILAFLVIFFQNGRITLSEVLITIVAWYMYGAFYTAIQMLYNRHSGESVFMFWGVWFMVYQYVGAICYIPYVIYNIYNYFGNVDIYSRKQGW